MSMTYRIKGARYLRKYTAASRSSCTSYMADVAKITKKLCTLPWKPVSTDLDATTTLHTEETLDWNAKERDRFDAAEWCGEHSDEMHRAYAQAACYVFKLPAAAVGQTIEKIEVDVTSDPYNPYGARIAAKTSATLTIPTACADCRTGDVYRAPDSDGLGAAPRLYYTDSDGVTTWYSNSEHVTLTPSATLVAAQYLFVFCLLENYNRGRDGWIEGSSCIQNDVSVTFAGDTEITGFDADEINDLGDFLPSLGYVVSDLGATPFLAADALTGLRSLTVSERGAHGLQTAYKTLLNGGGTAAKLTKEGRASGALWRVKNAEGGWSVEVGALVVPFVIPSASFSKVKLTYKTPTLSGALYRVFMKSGALDAATADLLATTALWDGSSDTGDWSLLGEITSDNLGTTLASDATKSEITFLSPAIDERHATVLIVAYLPPEGVSLTSSAVQGAAEFKPQIELA